MSYPSAVSVIRSTLAAAIFLAVAAPAVGLECGFITRDDCSQVCAGKTVIGCRNCGFWCEECECGQPLEPEMVCCHMKGATCEDAADISDAYQWMPAEECDRFWGGSGEKTCPREHCGQ